MSPIPATPPPALSQHPFSSPSTSSSKSSPYRNHHQTPYARSLESKTSPVKSWHSAPGADLALLSEMKASTADLNRFRRESQWLEDRVSRPNLQQRHPVSQRILNKALDLTRTITRRPPPYQRLPPPATSQNSTIPSIITTTVHLSPDSRVALTSLKMNLSDESEEQTRLESDQKTLQLALERIQGQIQTKQRLQSETEHKHQRLLTRQHELESELRRIQKVERACLELQEQQRSRVQEEVVRLEAKVRLLKEKNEVRDAKATMALRV
ncbi:hypothetical protein BGZ83_007105 [Gryganskiella cystojenkinii]|nr:hypothetical protein BGZ83_007105 [Gryganskiella cystojenkinii]